MRQQRQASQEVLQRKAALQRIADRRQNSRRILDSSSDSDDEYKTDELTSSTHSHFSDSSNLSSAATRACQVDQKPLQRLSQQKENRPQTHLPSAVRATEQAPQGSRPAASTSSMSTVGDQIAGSLAALAISGNSKPSSNAAVLAAAVAVKLPDGGSGSDSSNIEEPADIRPEQAAGLHIAEFHLQPKTANMLYKHQVEGVKWLWSLHKMRRGGILG